MFSSSLVDSLLEQLVVEEKKGEPLEGEPLGGAAKGGNRREQDLSVMQCNFCGSFGHTWLECPKGNQEMQKKEIARRAEQKARNASRALRRAKEEVGGCSGERR
jgi:hypothetical protein